ncbi:MAG: hypothetical protein WCQ41_05635 [Bacillota bacterium]
MIAVDVKAKWIWQKDNTIPNDIVVFKKFFSTSYLPEEAIAFISVDTKYWLTINSQMVVYEGGLFRESLPGCGYADKIDIAQFLQPGENVIELLCWYYGNQGRNNKDSGQAGLLFQCEELGFFSDESFLCQRHPAYYTPGEPKPSYLYGGDNIGFDANIPEGTFENAQIFDSATWGEVFERPIPQIKMYDAKECLDVQYNGQEMTFALPYAMQFVPLLECFAAGGEKIDIRSDRYVVNGGPGDEYNQYNSHRVEYICKPGLNQFESIEYLFGEKIVVSVSAPLENLKISYCESSYDTEITAEFNCDCEIVNKLIHKAARTLKVCMRDNFMDCPDRERGQWIGDVSVQVPQAFFVLDQKATLLIKKAIFDFINLRDGDVLKGNVPGPCASELPSQSLNAISEWGMIAQYYKYTGDKEVLGLAFEPCIQYLKLWDLQEDGLMNSRSGDWKWFDHLYNSDEKVLENAWYYSALCFAEKMASILGNKQFDDFIALRKKSIEGNFDRCFWKGAYYSSGSIVDDRANAMAVLSGLCKKENHEKIMKVLVSVFNATVYMENYVLIALCEMGYIHEAYKRMVSRYYNLAMNENTTLWEDFYILGTKNHAWSGAPITIAFRYFMGIDTADAFETFTVNPVQNLFKRMSCTFETKKGKFGLKN